MKLCACHSRTFAHLQSFPDAGVVEAPVKTDARHTEVEVRVWLGGQRRLDSGILGGPNRNKKYCTYSRCI